MSPKRDKAADKKIRTEAYKKLGIILVGILLLVNTIQLARFGEIVERVDMYNRGVIDELGGIRQDVVTFATDLNEIREFLLLPAKQYSFSESKEEELESQEEKSGSRTEGAVFGFLAGITEEQTYQKNAKLAEARVSELAKDQAFIESLNQNALKIGPVENNEVASLFKIKDASDNALFAFVIYKKTSTAKIQSALGTYQVKSTGAEPLKTEILQYFKDHVEEVAEVKALIEKQKAGIGSLASNESVAKTFREKKITLTPNPEETEESLLYYVENSEKDKLLTITIQRKDGALNFQDKNYQTFEEFLPAFVESVQKVDASSSREKLINTRRAELETIFNDAAFQDLLKNSQLGMEAIPREEYNKLLYDVKNAEGKTVFSFVIELSSGYYKILKDGQEIDLLSTLSGGSKKKP